jgi:hypothetical protein
MRSAVTVTNEETGRLTYYIPQEGLIATAGTQWVYVVSHSSHYGDENYPDKSHAGIGDVSVLIDHRGQLWTNAAHPCRYIWTMTSEARPFSSVEELLASPVNGDSPWRRMEN